MITEGTVEPGWGAVADAFVANFEERAEVGAAVCVYRHGRKVVDLWGGTADPASGRPWAEDTIVTFFSATKGVTAVAANLAIERGLLDPDAPVAAYWPEFAAAGKEGITVRQVLSHQAGLPRVDADLTLDEALAWEPVITALAAQAPLWEPGTQHGYHMRTFGWLVGELLLRTTGRTPGTFLRDEVTGPLGIDLWVGLPESEEGRVATLVPPPHSIREALEPFQDSLLLARVFANPGGHFDYDGMWNRRQLRECELPASNGTGDARGLARLYASCIGDGVDGHRTLQPATVAAATIEQVRGPDAVIIAESSFGLGFMLGTTFGAANPTSCFGHAGAGGSLAFADPASGLALGYVMNDLRFDPTAGDPRSETLVRAARAIAARQDAPLAT
ncbi:MAG TPA: serine hydrolase domain-containing protein [Iamia sp.]|jgi:CubicO group peptidase (beta-lactamase class C family)|nr:serine hydrolase domain-containing protein [Iamia sp.]